jgi:hypothetical protein
MASITLRQVGAAVAHDVQHRTEDFALQFRQRTDFEHGRRHEGALRLQFGRQLSAKCCLARGFHALDVAEQVLLGFGIDDGPMSVARRSGTPTRSSCIAPLSILMVLSAMSSCRNSTRSAEQRWPALSKAELSTSCTTCSGSAEESTIRAFWPPVSAISGMSQPSRAARSASVRLISCATSVDPGEDHGLLRAHRRQGGADGSPRPGSSCSAPAGTPASWNSWTAR